MKKTIPELKSRMKGLGLKAVSFAKKCGSKFAVSMKIFYYDVKLVVFNYSHSDAEYKKKGLAKAVTKTKSAFVYLGHRVKRIAAKIWSALSSRKFWLCVVAAFVVCCVIGGAYGLYCVTTAPDIDPKNIYESVARASTVYDDKGNKVDEIYYTEDRIIVDYKDIPEDVVNAFVAVEDKTFWKHHGLNLTRIAGAILESVLGHGEISGTSTITQQLARNVYLPNIKSERSLKRKITEIHYALQIERKLSKEEIVEAYLNTIYLGFGTYGISSAAQVYFSKDLSELSLVECAALAALPPAPTSYALLQTEKCPNAAKFAGGIYSNDISKERRDLVLALMKEQGYITEQEYRQSEGRDLKDFIDPTLKKTDRNMNYFRDYLIDQVIADLQKKMKIGETEAANMVYCGGLKIYSTLNMNAQKVIVQEFDRDYNFPYSVAGEKIQSAMVIADVRTGAIKAMVGGRKTKGQMLYNRATNPRQPGSSIKPLTVYSAALQKSFELKKEGKKYKYRNFGTDAQGTNYWGDYITAGSVVYDEYMTLNGEVWPVNSYDGYYGRQTVRSAIRQSINTCAVKIQRQVGNEYSINMLRKYGITTVKTDGDVNDNNTAALAIGGMTHGISPLEAALAYGTFANNGVRNDAMVYTKVCDSKNNIILKGKTKSTKVLDAGVAWIMNSMMQDVVKSGTGVGAGINGISVGGKTGTTQNQSDIWFNGFTPKYSASLWIGTDHNSEMSSMSGPAAVLWGKIMSQIPEAVQGQYPAMPDNVVQYNGEYYTKGTEYNGGYSYYNYNNGQNNYNYNGQNNEFTNDGNAENSGRYYHWEYDSNGNKHYYYDN